MAAPVSTVPNDASNPEVGVLAYVQEVAVGAVALLQAAPVVGDVCATLLAFGQLVDEARSNKEELAVLRKLCDVVIKLFLERSSGLPAEAAQGFEDLKEHVAKAETVAKLCSKGGTKFFLARKICKDIAAIRKNVLDFSVVYNLVLTNAMQAELAKLTTMLADKEKELKVTQKDLEAQKHEVMRMTAELESRDGASLDLEYRRIQVELHEGKEVLATMKKEIEDQRRIADLASRVKIPSGAPRVRDWYVERRAEVAQACDHLEIASSRDSSDGNSAKNPRVVGLAGPGGAGKSTVASMVIAREDVRASFHKGVLWLPVGQGAKDRLPSLMLDLAGMVHKTALPKSCRAPQKAGERTDDGVAYIKEMVAEGRERLLVVADDVWEVEVLQELKSAGTWVLYTTRHDSLLPDVLSVPVREIAREEAEMVLRRAADLDESAVLPDAAYELMRRCEFAVLDIAFVGRWGVVRGRRKELAWQMALDGILEAQAGGEGVGPLSWRSAVLRAGLEELAVDNPLNKELYLALAVLPMGLTFPSEVAAALLYDDALSGDDLEDLEVAEEVAATLERWSILIRVRGGEYRVHDEHSAFIQRCLSTNKDTQDRVLPRWRKHVSSVRALLSWKSYDLVEIWDSLASDEGDVVDPRPYDRALDAMDMSSAELPEAVEAAAWFYMAREDVEGAYTTFSKLLKLQETTITPDSSEDMLVTILQLHACARTLGREEEAEAIQRRADATLEEMGKEPINLDSVAETLLCFMGFCCLLRFPFLFSCFFDDAVDDSVDGRKSMWCIDDSASERVFIPEASRNNFVVVGLGGATVRMSEQLDSPVLRTLSQGTVVVVAKIRSRRAHILEPVDGWTSLSAENGDRILESATRSTKYQVMYREGIFVRSSANIDGGRIVRIAPFGTVLKATGKTDIYDAVERIEVEDGWVSMRLREDTGSGVQLLNPLD